MKKLIFIATLLGLTVSAEETLFNLTVEEQQALFDQLKIEYNIDASDLTVDELNNLQRNIESIRCFDLPQTKLIEDAE